MTVLGFDLLLGDVWVEGLATLAALVEGASGFELGAAELRRTGLLEDALVALLPTASLAFAATFSSTPAFLGDEAFGVVGVFGVLAVLADVGLEGDFF